MTAPDSFPASLSGELASTAHGRRPAFLPHGTRDVHRGRLFRKYLLLILSLVGWAAFARVIRGMVLSIRKEDYVQAARAMGLSHPRIIAKHILPNTMGYVVVATTLRIPGYILGESALSLLGLGIMEPTPSWGNMLQKAMDILELNQHPWVLWPGVFIFLAIMAFNLVGDGLRDAVDPRGLATK